ncbi:MAG TPA: hypothetical protein DDY77_05425 [Clostridiales bacterium]|nr:hypothetical protein [Clostridiales bacterium]
MLLSVGCSKTEPNKEADGSLVVTPGETQGEVIRLLTVYPDDSLGTNTCQLKVELETTSIAFNDKYKQVSWTIAWKDASSQWASGKKVSDYVKLTTKEENGLTANLEKVNNFGEQIIVTATPIYYSKVKATATVDCFKRLSSYWFRDDDLSFLYLNGKLNSDCDVVNYGYFFLPGTLDTTPNLESISYYIFSTSELLDDMNETIRNLMREHNLSEETYFFDFGTPFKNNAPFEINRLFRCSDEDRETLENSVAYKICYNKAVELLQKNYSDLSLKISLSTYYNDKFINEVSEDFSFEFNTPNYTPFEIVSNVSFTDGSAIF